MKTYNRKKIKNIFDKNLAEISVSEKLKKETIEKTNKIPKHSFFQLSNCAAIFIVSLLCYSIYINSPVHNQHSKLNSTPLPHHSNLEITNENQLISTKQINHSTTNKEKISDNYRSYKSSLPAPVSAHNETVDLTKQNQINMLSDYSQIINEQNTTFDTVQKSYYDIAIGTSEEQLLSTYSNLEKIENGYLLKENTQNTIFKISNGTVSGIINE